MRRTLLLIAVSCLAVAGCDLLDDDDESAAELLAGESTGITITLEWFNTADLDLHVTDPEGETIYFAHPSSESGGSLDLDDTDGFGPENVVWTEEDAPEGEYRVEVDHFSGPAPADYKVTVRQSTSPEVEYTGTIDQGQMVSVITFEYESELPDPAAQEATPTPRPAGRARVKPSAVAVEARP